jgi:tetratricopeptide (TPR) repeat protein
VRGRSAELLSALAAGLLLSFVGSASSAATRPPTGRLVATPVQMLDLAEELIRRGSIADAETILSLVANDPNLDVRNEARFRFAKLLQSQGKSTRAAEQLRRIIDEKPNAGPARLFLAQMLEQLGDVDGALRQVRAIQATGLPANVARLVDRYSEALRARRPFGGSFQIALAPDSNINHATNSDKLGTVLGDFDISDESQAKSGTGIALQGQIYRRFALGADGRQLLVRLSGFGNLYKKHRFNDIALDLGAGPELQIGRNRVNLELGVTQRWYGQKPFSRSLRVGVLAARPIGRTSQLRFAGTASLVDNRINELEDGKDYSGELSFEHAFSPTTGASLSVSALREALKGPAYSTTSWRIGLLGWRDIGRVTLTMSGQVGRLHADERLALFPDKRSDRYARVSLAASVRRLSFQGLAPVARLIFERNKSTIAFYDYSPRRMELGFERAF